MQKTDWQCLPIRECTSLAKCSFEHIFNQLFIGLGNNPCDLFSASEHEERGSSAYFELFGQSRLAMGIPVYVDDSNCRVFWILAE